MGQRSTSFGYRFGMLYRFTRFFLNEGLKETEITPGEVPFVAELLLTGEDLTQDELSQRFEIDKAATARALSQLEKKGYVQRRVNPDNRRQNLVCATEKAYAVKEDFHSALSNVGEILSKDFTQEDKTAALELLDRMIENAREEKYGTNE